MRQDVKQLTDALVEELAELSKEELIERLATQQVVTHYVMGHGIGPLAKEVLVEELKEYFKRLNL